AAGTLSGFAAAGTKADVFAGITPQPEVGEEVESKLEVFWEAWDRVQKNYYEGPLDPRELVEGATRGMVRSTGDDYTDWVDAESAQIDRQRLEGEFEGIGATVELTEDGVIRIVRPLPGSPAEEAGLQPNDLVLAVDGVATKGKSLEELIREVRGPAGTTVILTIQSESETQTRDVAVVRRAIVIPSVVSKSVDEFGYVRLSNFGAKTTGELRDSIRELRSNGAEGLILDLRNNPGGFLNTAVDVAGEFFPSGTLVVSEKSRTEGDVEFKSSRRGTAEDLPVVVLINGGSASASEIVAGAIKDHGRGKLLGTTTFGKGSVQIPFELRDNSVVRITVAIWETPGGTHLDGVGIEPDFKIDGDAAELGGDDDPYLEAARRVLRGQECCANLGLAA
ncbi:MAG: S41 family peptidase, partial [Dehalococcoidia bacterium]|nr:S41 family peptidase [Dehalococcoidia bacterium]